MKKLFSIIVFVQIFTSCLGKHDDQIVYKMDTHDVIFFENSSIVDSLARKIFREGLNEVQLENYRSAKEKFIEADILENNNPVILNAIAQAELRLGNTKKFHEILIRSLSIDSTYGSTYINLSGYYLSIKDFEKSKAILFKGKNQISEKNLHEKSVYLAQLAATYKGLFECSTALSYINAALKISQDPKFTNEASKLKKRIEFCLE